MAGPLGRNAPPDWSHVEKYPLTAEIAPTDVPVVLGVNWYDSFDTPKQLGPSSFHLPDVAKGEKIGSIRGGHCIPLEPMGSVRHNKEAQRKFYNQGQEGACVGFGCSRAQTIEKGALYDAFWLYDEARKTEGTYPSGEGSTVRAGFGVLKAKGHRAQVNAVCEREVHDGPVDASLGVSAYRWATSVDQVLAALARPNAAAVPVVNSWGDDYPAVVWLPVATLARLLHEEGEAGIATER